MEVVQVVVRLTGREADVLRLIARGCTYVQVAAAPGISTRRGAADFLTTLGSLFI